MLFSLVSRNYKPRVELPWEQTALHTQTRTEKVTSCIITTAETHRRKYAATKGIWVISYTNRQPDKLEYRPFAQTLRMINLKYRLYDNMKDVTTNGVMEL